MMTKAQRLEHLRVGHQWSPGEQERWTLSQLETLHSAFHVDAAAMNAPRELVTTQTTQTERFQFANGNARVHSKDTCVGPNCTIHNPSDHLMRDWPLVLRETGLVERACTHGVGHPDPDSVAFFRARGHEWVGTHGCDGCCIKPDTTPNPSESVVMVIGDMAKGKGFLLGTTKINTGGLLRCCISSLSEFINNNPKQVAYAGAIQRCNYGSEPRTEMILNEEGTWRWNHP